MTASIVSVGVGEIMTPSPTVVVGDVGEIVGLTFSAGEDGVGDTEGETSPAMVTVFLYVTAAAFVFVMIKADEVVSPVSR